MNRSFESIKAKLQQIDGRGYKAYREIAGRWDFPTFTLHIDHVQGDPFAAPSRVRVLISAEVARFEPALYSTLSRTTGICWLLAHRFGEEAHHRSDFRGSGKSGKIQMEAPGQEVLVQTATLIHADGAVEARFTVGLPARGRTVLGQQAAALLLDDLPAIVSASLLSEAYPPKQLWQHVATNEDADALRTTISQCNWIAFVADGAILPRRSGIDDRPLPGNEAIPFASPDSLRQEVELPHAGKISGLAIPEGVILIVGGGYHGKSTLLRAIERGVYNHCPGDGRELVVSQADLVKIRAEDGRSVVGVNISPFINDLPLGQSTTNFSTANASGSTSQAAAIMEALEVGAIGLLIDEDTAATNFMIRDARMQKLVPKEHEPITPLIDRVRQLYTERGVSSILVIGGSGDYLDVADTVLAMHNFAPTDVTAQAQSVAQQQPTQRQSEAVAPLPESLNRRPIPHSIDPSRGKRAVDIKTRGLQRIQFGQENIDLNAVEQLVAWGQTRAIGEAIWYAGQHYFDGQRTLEEVFQQVCEDVERDGLDVLDSRKVGNLARFRKHELAAALNRLRMLRVG
ncbi:MAG: ABC-ATPase domain-containing protein [Chloroflexota bacterium]